LISKQNKSRQKVYLWIILVLFLNVFLFISPASFACEKGASVNSCLIAKSSLLLPSASAPENVPKFDDEKYIEQEWGDNDALIKNLTTRGFIYKIIRAVKYIIGGVFMIFLGMYVVNFISAGDKVEELENFKRRILYSLIGFIILALAEPFSQAFNVATVGGSSGAMVTTPEGVRLSAELVGFSYRSAAKLLQYLLGGVALIAMGASAFRIVGATGDEETVTSARKSLVWAMMGLIIAGGSSLFIDRVFAPEVITQVSDGANPLTQHAELLRSGQSKARLLIIAYVKYFQTFTGAGAVLMLFLAGFKMVSASGNDEIVTKQRKMITWIFMGLLVILFSETFVSIFMPEKDGEVIAPGSAQISSFSAQVGGFTNFLLTFTGGLAVLALIVGALYITTAVANPEQAEKGKKILLAATLGIIITISAYALVNTVLSGVAS